MNRGNCRELFRTFFKIGAFTFGGGYAMIPLIKREVVEEKHWLTDDEIFDLIAIAESTPGPLAVNSATFVGSRIAGWQGALAATSGVILPSFFVILILSQLLTGIEDIPLVKSAFQGIRAGVLALIGNALASLFLKLPKQAFSYSVMALAFVMACFLHINAILVLLFCAAAGILWNRYRERGKRK